MITLNLFESDWWDMLKCFNKCTQTQNNLKLGKFSF